MTLCSYIQCSVYKCPFPPSFISPSQPPAPTTQAVAHLVVVVLSVLAFLLLLQPPSALPSLLYPQSLLSLLYLRPLFPPPPPFPPFPSLQQTSPAQRRFSYYLLLLLRLLVLHRSLAVLLFLALLPISRAMLLPSLAVLPPSPEVLLTF